MFFFSCIVTELCNVKKKLHNFLNFITWSKSTMFYASIGFVRRYVMYLLTPWSRTLFVKLTVNFATSQVIPRIFRIRKSLTVPTSARHLSLSRAKPIQSTRPPPTSWRSILILSSHLRLGLPNGLFPSGFSTNTLCTPATDILCCILFLFQCEKHIEIYDIWYDTIRYNMMYVMYF
jgi:hypothetical protein